MTSYQKLKAKVAALEQEKAALRRDLKKVVLDKDHLVKTRWYILFKSEEDMEAAMWDSGRSATNEPTLFKGLLSQLKKKKP